MRRWLRCAAEEYRHRSARREHNERGRRCSDYPGGAGDDARDDAGRHRGSRDRGHDCRSLIRRELERRRLLQRLLHQGGDFANLLDLFDCLGIALDAVADGARLLRVEFAKDERRRPRIVIDHEYLLGTTRAAASGVVTRCRMACTAVWIRNPTLPTDNPVSSLISL